MRLLVLIFFAAGMALLAGTPEVMARPASYEQVVDNAIEDRFEADDGWGTSSYGRGVEENNYRFARPAQGSSDARFKVEIPETANYTVYARWPDVKGGNDATQIGVVTTSGTRWTQVNQQQDGGQWVRLGAFEMQAGDDYSVVFSRETNGKGYVIADAVKVEWDSTAAAPPKSEKTRVSESKAPEGRSGQDLVREARKWIGVRYQLGGQTRRGVDCSGLTMMVFKRFGVSLPHWDDKQYRMGTSVPKGQERPGDLVFFNEHGRGTSHVGMYSGNGKLIHASDYFNKVTESDMKYIKGYVGARRMPMDGRSADRLADQQSEAQDDSGTAPEAEASSPYAGSPSSSTDRFSPSSKGSVPQEAENNRQVKTEEYTSSRTQETQRVRQPHPDDVREKAAPSNAKPPSKSNEREDQKRRVGGGGVN